MDEVKIKALKYTFVQMVACASIIFIISILVKYAPLMLSILSGVPHLIWWVMGVFAAVYVWYLINYSLIQTPLLSPWIERTSEQPPTCDLIHAELITKRGRSKMLWRVHPSEVDFSHDAEEPVSCYMIVRRIRR